MKFDNKLVLEEKVLSLFTPDPLVSSQYLDTLRSKAVLQPEKKLMLAVLEDAITCCQKFHDAKAAKKKKLFNDAVEWMLAENIDWIFSFENICETLGLAPDYMRQGLLGAQWRRLIGNCTTSRPERDKKREESAAAA